MTCCVIYNFLFFSVDEVVAFPVLEIDQGKIVDTNGAGDAFVGGKYCLAIMNMPIIGGIKISPSHVKRAPQ